MSGFFSAHFLNEREIAFFFESIPRRKIETTLFIIDRVACASKSGCQRGRELLSTIVVPHIMSLTWAQHQSSFTLEFPKNKNSSERCQLEVALYTADDR